MGAILGNKQEAKSDDKLDDKLIGVGTGGRSPPPPPRFQGGCS